MNDGGESPVNGGDGLAALLDQFEVARSQHAKAIIVKEKLVPWFENKGTQRMRKHYNPQFDLERFPGIGANDFCRAQSVGCDGYSRLSYTEIRSLYSSPTTVCLSYLIRRTI